MRVGYIMVYHPTSWSFQKVPATSVRVPGLSFSSAISVNKCNTCASDPWDNDDNDGWFMVGSQPGTPTHWPLPKAPRVAFITATLGSRRCSRAHASNGRASTGWFSYVFIDSFAMVGVKHDQMFQSFSNPKSPYISMVCTVHPRNTSASTLRDFHWFPALDQSIWKENVSGVKLWVGECQRRRTPSPKALSGDSRLVPTG